MDNLFYGLDKFDNAAISAALTAPFFQNLEVEVMKVIRTLLEKYKVPVIAGGENNASTSAGDDVDPNDEAGLCL